ncbi:hypothetical protein I6N96_15070 [Enterococcus sp. BWM-S5]|uniref:Uncharacterized protein n=1 Tax=Enterococcus larvae TaxID=2794352 RepID=A0ABS4CMV6_9ENTE|nr:hypothetical protein [Enterococcus larvae]MBP1047607.1 hypothetical protein [Enterococcus larvae]
MIIEFEGYQIECFVYGKKRSKEELSRIVRGLFREFPQLNSRELLARFMAMYDYQLLPRNSFLQKADMLVDLDISLVVEIE